MLNLITTTFDLDFLFENDTFSLPVSSAYNQTKITTDYPRRVGLCEIRIYVDRTRIQYVRVEQVSPEAFDLSIHRNFFLYINKRILK